MATIDSLNVISQVLFCLVCLPWMFANAARTYMVPGTWRHAFFHRICGELRPFVLPIFILRMCYWWQVDTWVGRVFDAATFIYWVYWISTHDDDDDSPWKKRGRKLRRTLQVRFRQLAPSPT